MWSNSGLGITLILYSIIFNIVSHISHPYKMDHYPKFPSCCHITKIWSFEIEQNNRTRR
uniref:Uncharacterized protein n=1 Tax=Kalanchoe fedtschenkoi TaxID=63787 RepID=A0A7N0UIZ9_KALFE